MSENLRQQTATAKPIWSILMRYLTVVLLATWSAGPMWTYAQQTTLPGGTSTPALSQGANLPIEKIGNNDLLGLSVYDSPELSRTVRVGSDGDIRLPMVEQHIHASGLYPEELEKAIAAILVDGKVIRRPVVAVSVLEYMSRPITVVGSVRTPLTFQAAGPAKLLEALSRAGGLSENAGPEILINSPGHGADVTSAMLVRRIPVHGLFTGTQPELNVVLEGGEEIRVPEADRIFVVGNVKKPGFFYLTDGPESSIMKALAFSDGLEKFSGKVAYIYRTEEGTQARTEIPVQLRKIMDRKSPDVTLKANDIVYVPNAAGRETTAKVIAMAIPIAASLGITLLYIAGR